ncbi:MAG: hypothetical protein ACREMR_11770 [Gemmatimonadales bacterium]
MESTLIVLLLMSSLAVIAFAGAVTNIRTTNIDYRNARVSYAAEAGADAIMAQLFDAQQDGYLSDAELAALTPPTVPGFTVDSFKASKLGGIVQETITDGPFTGLYSLTQRVEIFSSAVDAQRNRSAVLVSAKAQAIPIFQFAQFFDMDAQLWPGERRDMWGRVHVNGDLFLHNSNNIYFHDWVTAVGRVIRKRKTDHVLPEPDCCPKIDDVAGLAVNLDFDSENTPDPATFRARSAAQFDSRLQTNAHSVPTLRVPLPVGVSQREVIRPREAGDTDEERETKFAWRADLYVTVDMTNIRDKKDVCGGVGGLTDHPNITVVRYDGGAVPAPALMCVIFDFKWDTFRDRMEVRWVDALTVPMDLLRGWATATAIKPRVIYVEFKLPAGPLAGTPADVDPKGDNAANGGRPFPALRLRNAVQLHGPLTIGTEHPIYIWGDYNTVSKQPAAVFGDILTILTAAWRDTVTNSMPDGSAITHNLSIIQGAVRGGGCYHHDPGPCTAPPLPPGELSGSNRHLEDLKNSVYCGGGSCMYRWRGSQVYLHTPIFARLATPDVSLIYKPPTRDWGFDNMLKVPDSLPPATPVVGNVIHTGFRPVY